MIWAERIALGVFVWLVCATLDLLAVAWQHQVRDQKALGAALVSGAITLIGVCTYIAIFDRRWLLVPNVLGHMTGAFLGVWWTKRKTANAKVKPAPMRVIPGGKLNGNDQSRRV